MENLLPIHYRLEIYEDSFINDLSGFLDSSSPLPAIAVGDYFYNNEIGNWVNPPKKGEVFRVQEIKHMFYTVENSFIGYTLWVCLKVVKDPKIPVTPRARYV